jgi:hypothetical protein
MNSKNRGLRVASVVFGLVCLAQLTRLVMHIEVIVGGNRAPFWISVIAFLVTGGLSFWLWKLSRSQG